MSDDGAEYQRLCDDLAAEECELDAILAPLRPDQWRLPTPAPDWDVRDQVGHLACSEELAGLACADPARYEREVAAMLADLDRTERALVARPRAMDAAAVLAWWRDGREATVAALRMLSRTDRLPWAGRWMSAASFASARLMETWAHGQDVADALGVGRPATGRLRHVADLGVRTMGFSFAIRGLPVPETPVRIELTAPSGGPWAWGPPDAPASVTGPALDFCLVVTRRRPIGATAIAATGAAAAAWMDVAQAFAGPPAP